MKPYDKALMAEYEKGRILKWAYLIVISVSVIVLSALIIDLKTLCLS